MPCFRHVVSHAHSLVVVFAKPFCRKSRIVGKVILCTAFLIKLQDTGESPDTDLVYLQ